METQLHTVRGITQYLLSTSQLYPKQTKTEQNYDDEQPHLIGASIDIMVLCPPPISSVDITVLCPPPTSSVDIMNLWD